MLHQLRVLLYPSFSHETVPHTRKHPESYQLQENSFPFWDGSFLEVATCVLIPMRIARKINKCDSACWIIEISSDKHPQKDSLSSEFCILTSWAGVWSIQVRVFSFGKTEWFTTLALWQREIEDLSKRGGNLRFQIKTRWCFQQLCIFTPNPGKMIRFDGRAYFFKWVGSTTN